SRVSRLVDLRRPLRRFTVVAAKRNGLPQGLFVLQWLRIPPRLPITPVAMERRQVEQDSRTGWSSGAGAHEDWTDLLKTCTQRTEEMRAEHRGRAGLDETEEIVFALARAVEQR